MAPRALLLCYHFHPSSEVGAKRTNALTEYLIAGGAPPVLVSAFSEADAEQLETQTGRRFPGCTLVPIPESGRTLLDLMIMAKASLARWRGRRTKLSSALTVAADQSTSEVPCASRLKDAFFAALYAVDDKKRWSLRASRKAASAAKTHRAEIIFASGPPMSPLGAAILAGRRAGVPVVIDFRDPCFYPLSGGGHSWVTRFSNSIRRRFEAWVVRRADAIVCTAPSLGELLRQRYPDAADRVHFIPNGFDGTPAPPAPTHGLLHIVFAGELYLNRNPLGFLEAVSALLVEEGIDRSRVRVTFVGKCDTYRGQELRTWLAGKPAGHVTQILPKVGQEALQDIYANATALLNLAQGQPMQIPAKTFEQLASGKELLLVCETDSDTARLVQGVPGVHQVTGDDPTGLLDVLRGLYDRHVRQSRTDAPTKDQIAAFSRAEQNQKLAGLFDRCIKNYGKR